MFRSESLTAEWVIGAAVGFLAVTAALVLTGYQTWEAALMSFAYGSVRSFRLGRFPSTHPSSGDCSSDNDRRGPGRS